VDRKVDPQLGLMPNGEPFEIPTHCPKCGGKYQDEDEARFGEPCDQCTAEERAE